MADGKTVGKNIKAMSVNLEVNGMTYAKELSKAALSELINATPVDTSAALSNWQVGINNRPRNQIPAYVIGKRGSTRAASAAATRAAGYSKINLAKLGNWIYIRSTSPYMGKLNAGYSPQADPGFVKEAVRQAQLRVRKRKRKFLNKPRSYIYGGADGD